MTPTELLAAPNIPASPPLTKFDRERLAFAQLKPQLLAEYRDQFVAIHEGRIVGNGGDLISVAQAAYEQFGGVPIFVDRVSDVPHRIERIPTPRVRNSREPR